MKIFSNVLLRGITLGVKFIIVLYFAQILSPKEFGVYVLAVAIVTFFTYGVGFEIQTYTVRKASKSSLSEQIRLFEKGLSLNLLMSIVFIPLIIAICSFNDFDDSLSLIILFVISFEAIAAQINWYLLFNNAQIMASVILFLRSVGWGVAFLILVPLGFIDINIKTLLICWSVGSVSVAILGWRVLSKIYDRNLLPSFEWSFTKNIIKYCVPMLIAALSARAIFSVDKLTIEHLLGAESVAVYGLYVTFGYAVMSFIDATIVSFNYRKIVEACTSTDKAKVKTIYLLLTFYTGVLALVLGGCGIPVIYFVVKMLDAKIYAEHFDVIYTIVFVFVFLSMSTISTHFLNALSIKKEQVLINISSIVLFVSLSYIVSSYYKEGLASISISLLITSFSLFVFKADVVLNKVRSN